MIKTRNADAILFAESFIGNKGHEPLLEAVAKTPNGKCNCRLVQ